MAIVCQTSAAAAELRDFADLKNQKYLSKSNIQNLLSGSASAQIKEESFFLDGEKEVVGIVTLENVIERILLTDIHDEKDREAARQLRQRAETSMYHTPSSAGIESSDFLRNSRDRQVSNRNASVFQSRREKRVDSTADGEVFKSRFIREYYNVLLDDI